MASQYLAKKIGPDRDKIVLFAILVLGVVIASILVKVRNRIGFSRSIALENSGVLVSVPDKSPWLTIGRWQYENNGFSLTSIMRLDSRATASVQWRYELVPIPAADEYFRQRAAKLKNEVFDSGQIKLGSLSMDWASIRLESINGDVFIGVVQLADGRTLTLEVAQTAGFYDLSKHLFETSAKSLKFEGNKLLADGIAVVQEFNSMGLSEAIYGRSRQKYFMIKDKAGSLRGFFVDGYGETTDEQNARTIAAASLYYIQRNGNADSEQAFFNADELGETFKWIVMSKQLPPTGRIDTVIERDSQGNISISSLRIRKKKLFIPGKALIPEILLEPLLSEFIRGDKNRIILDILLSSGRIVQSLITKIDSESVEIRFHDERGSSQVIHFDENMEINQIDMSGEPGYDIIRTSRDELLETFVEWEKEIFKIEQYLAENKK